MTGTRAAHSAPMVAPLEARRAAADVDARALLGTLDLRAAGLEPLAGAGADLWCGGGAVQTGTDGALRWADDGHWLFGALDLPEDARGVEALAQQAYGQVFACLARHGRPLVRLWNYLPRINDEAGGLERYRQFNMGRQQAFVAAGVDAFAGAPAACCLGKAGGPLAVRFLAGRTRVQPLENPRQVPAWRYSRRYGPKAPTFSRAVLAEAGGGRVGLFVSGTASIVGEDSLHEGDVRAQTRETLVNLQAVLDAAAARCDARFGLDDLDLTVYLRHPADLPAVRAQLAAAAPAAAARAAWWQADVCRRELGVEIEAHAFAGGTLA